VTPCSVAWCYHILPGWSGILEEERAGINWLRGRVNPEELMHVLLDGNWMKASRIVQGKSRWTFRLSFLTSNEQDNHS
jgi:hypothetical protein